MANGLGSRVGVVTLALALLLSIAGWVAASEPGAPEWLTTNLERIRQKHGVPALSCALVVDGSVVAAAATGVRVHGSDVAVTRDDPFHLGSITKVMTATLVGVLIERGDLRWETTLASAFPELAKTMQPAYREVTIPMLLAHQSGMPFQPRTEGPDEFGTRESTLPGRRYEYVRAAVRDQPEAPPGAKTVYSGGCIVVAAMAERVTGRSWEDLVREHVFRPLGMEHAGFGAMSSVDAIDGPWEHVVLNGEVIPFTPDPGYALETHAPAGRNVHCSAPDLARFLAAHLPGRRPALLRAETLARLHAPVGRGPFAPGWQIGDGGRLLVHDGCNGRNYAVARVDLDRNVAWCAMSNLAAGRGEAACAEAAGELVGMSRDFAALPRTTDSLAFGKEVTASNVFQGMGEYAASKACDGSFATRWATDDATREAWIQVDLGSPRRIARAVIHEEYSPRVQAFAIEYREGDTWKTAASGTRIGPRLDLRFPPVEARVVRLRILSATIGPTISEFQLMPP